jgi:hypothetical protein
MPARERWSRENPGSRWGLHCTIVAGGRGGGRGEGHGFSYLLELHMTYLAGSHVLKRWPGIRLKINTSFFSPYLDGWGHMNPLNYEEKIS